jgi:hypothetical protein
MRNLTPAPAPSEVGACEACGNEAGPRLSIHWVPRFRAALCFLCRDLPPPTWAHRRLDRIAAGKRLVVLLWMLLLTGCGSGLVRINGDAPVAWLEGDPSDLRAYAEARGAVTPPGTYWGGLYDREAKVIITARSYDDRIPKRLRELGWQLNEFRELIEDVGDPGVAAYLVTGGDLDALCGDLDDGDMPPESEAKVRAMIEARRRAKAEQP